MDHGVLPDILSAHGPLFLGSRLKRLAERMQSDVVRVAQEAGLGIQPGQYPLLAVLDRDGPRTTAQLATALQQSQPTVTQSVARLAVMGLVDAARDRRDQRHKTISLTEAGRTAIAQSKLRVWPEIEAAVRELLSALHGPFLDQVAQLETALAAVPLDARARAAAPPPLTIREYTDALAADFRDINLEWIEAMYRVEATDRDVLDHPRARILAPGGAILFVEAAGLGIVGTCALQKTATSDGSARYELTKMGVRGSVRGRKAGEFLLAAIIERAAAMGADVLYLLSNRKSAAAIHLYEKLGFRHDDGIMEEYGRRYARCDVAMRYFAPEQG